MKNGMLVYESGQAEHGMGKNLQVLSDWVTTVTIFLCRDYLH